MVDYPDPYVDEEGATMRIPNREIRTLFKKEVMRYLSNLEGDSELLRNLLRGLLGGNAADFEEALSKFLRLLASFYDTAARESFHQGVSDSPMLKHRFAAYITAWCWAFWLPSCHASRWYRTVKVAMADSM